MLPVAEAVNIPFVQQFIGTDGAVHANETMESAASAMLDELETLTHVLEPARDRPLAAA
jgi:hypothetical protein